jgi:predicted dehydrogenase
MAAGYAADAAMAKYYPYAAHSQVLRDHPRLDWQVVIDPDPIARQVALSNWEVPIVVSSIDELGDKTSEIDIVVLATPPSARLEIVSRLPCLYAVLTEKPLAEDLLSANRFLEECSSRKLMLQVNYWRRADTEIRSLKNGGLAELIGEPVAVNFFYGNGLLNNGSHMIDMARMFFGDIANYFVLDKGNWPLNGPIPHDINPNFALRMSNNTICTFSPLDFREYRENGLIVWGRTGRLDILNEGLVVRYYNVTSNRAMSGEHEIPSDKSVQLKTSVGNALYFMYDNLVDALDSKNPDLLFSPGSSALVTSTVVDNIYQAATSNSVS